ncbi:MAG TPA: sulfatase [Caulobacterales bacterium]|jgi:arylsulfatase A-like enzyme|nr:sulfatase [Caulobacterales bacterium]
MPPNFLFIVLDDLNAWIGALGRHPNAYTPNIDALAARGILFTNAYCSVPYCNASRMGMYTGRLAPNLGVYHNEPFWDAAERPATLMERLRARGYATIGAGKVFHGVFDYEQALFDRLGHAPWKEVENRDDNWDIFHPNLEEPLPPGRPLNQLFDFSAPDSVPAMYRLFDWGPCAPDQEAALPDERSVDALVRFLEQPTSAPFFCAAGLYKPHLPWHAPQRFFDLIPEDVALPLVRPDDLDDAPEIARAWALNPPDHELVTSRGVWKQAVRAYLACIAYADHLVGRLIEALERGGAGDATTVILCGDNGYHLGEKLHWRKFALWEEATRVPLIYAPAGRRTHQRITEPVSLIDIFPSVLADAGADPGPVDGQRFEATVAGAGRETPVISTWGRGNHSLRTARWRYTRYSDGSEELFDHAIDGHEWTNLCGAPAFDAVREDLRAMLARAVAAEL